MSTPESHWGELANMGDEELATQICAYASRLAAATCRFLLAIAEYDRRRAWAVWETTSMVAWLAWRCGISPVTARQHLRVAHALADLPLVRERFAAGELSYSQVRAISRVATPATEAELVRLAQSLTAGQLDTVTRAYRRTKAVAAAEALQRDRRRVLRWSYEDDGSLIATLHLAPEEAEIITTAIAARMDHADVEDAEQDGALDPHGAAQADALVAILADSLGASEAEGDGEHATVTILAEAPLLAESAGGETEGVCQVADGPGLCPETVRRLACDQPTVTLVHDQAGSVLDVGRRTRRINRALRRALAFRDSGCRFPGCTHSRTEAHHIRHWIDGGTTNLDNLISLCARHHHRHHEGGFRIRNLPDGRVQFERPDGTVIPANWVPAPLSADQGTRLDVDVAETACQTDWDGTRLDHLDWIVEDLLRRDGIAEGQSAPPLAAVG